MRSRVHNRTRDRGGKPIRLAWPWALPLVPPEGTGGACLKKNRRSLPLVIWNASSPHYRRALEASKESAYGECRCERPADRAVGAEWARTGVFGEASSSSPCCPVAI